MATAFTNVYTKAKAMHLIYELITGFFGFIIENCTGVLLKQRTLLRHNGIERTGLLQSATEDSLEDFTKFDADDTIFREFDPPENEEEDPNAWKKKRPRLSTTFWRCLKYVFLMQTLSGTAIAVLAIATAVIDFNSAMLCFTMVDRDLWYKLPRKIQAVRVTAQSIEGFCLQLWSFLLLSIVFPWSMIKELNLPTLNLLVAFVDVTYRLCFQIYGIYDVPWMSYPLNALFLFLTTLNSFILARHLSPPRLHGWSQVLRLTCGFAAQFVLGILSSALILYKILPWFNQQDGYTKVLVASFCPLVTFFPKLFSRISAQRLQPIHPGTAHVFVALVYGSSAIGFRIIQAEMNSFKLYIALGIVHAAVDLVERLTITLRDHIWDYLYKFASIRRRPALSRYRSPRSRRFISDHSIQIMLQEATALVTALGFVYLYHFMYSDIKPPFTDYSVIVDFLIRALAGLFIDLIFNTLSVVIQTHYMNFAVMRVWKKKWRRHVLVNAIVSMMSVIYFSRYLFVMVRDKYNYSTHSLVRYAWNCTLPFKG